MCLYTLKHFCLRHTPEFLNDKKVSVEKVKYFHSISKKKKKLAFNFWNENFGTSIVKITFITT